jgi:3-hydroxyisobutyrate dehydrogenase
MTSVRIAVLGTGTMGAPIAANLVTGGHDVIVWNRTRAKAEAVEGAAVADTPTEAARGAEVLLTMLTDGDAVKETVRGIDALPLWIQMSTVGIEATSELAAMALERGATFVDAPVLGTREPAVHRELVVLASGPSRVRATCEPIFNAIGKKTIWVGEAGAGTRLKLVVNSWLVSLVTALAEVVAFARAIDVDPELFFTAIADGPLDTTYADAKGHEMMAEEFPPSFALKLARKDADLALAAARHAGVELPVAQAVAKQFERAARLGHEDEDVAAVYFAATSGDG